MREQNIDIYYRLIGKIEYPKFKSRRELTEKSFQSGEKEKACKR